jgi:hypothetical protein
MAIGTVLFAILLVLPFLLLAAAQAWATFDQDHRIEYLVRLRPGIQATDVVEDHVERVKAIVLFSWSSHSAGGGYRARMTKRGAKKLGTDQRVHSIEPIDEFLNP